MNEDDREEVKEIMAACSSKCIKWWQFLSIIGAILVVLVTGMWTVGNTKVDKSEYYSDKNSLHKELCDIKKMQIKDWNRVVNEFQRLPEPTCIIGGN